MSEKIIEFDRVVAGYTPSLTILNETTLDVRKGEITLLIGPNGAGKSTVLKTLFGLLTPRSGEVRFEGQVINGASQRDLLARGIAFVPQGHNVFPNLTVEQNLRIAGLLFDPAFVTEIYALFPVLAERRQQRAGSMSGGEQQMLALGMALMTKPKWLLLDEPSTGLAPVIVRNVMRRLAEINERMGVGLIVVEQNVPATLKMVQQTMILRSGRIAFQGSAQELSGNTDLWKWF